MSASLYFLCIFANITLSWIKKSLFPNKEYQEVMYIAHLKNRSVSCILRCIVVVSMLCAANFEVCAQRMVARPFPFFHDLYSNEIFDVYQDKTGYIWLGTTSDLVRYDGQRLVSFRSDYQHPERMAGNSMTYMADNGCYLWVGTNSGITLYDRKNHSTRILDDKRIRGRRITDVKAAADQSVWIALEDRIYHCSADASSIQDVSPFAVGSGKGINQLYIDHQDKVWLLSNGGLWGYSKKARKFLKYPKLGHYDAPYTMLQGRDGHYWIGTWGEGLWKFNPKVMTAACYERQLVKVSHTGEENLIFYRMVQDDMEGYIWLLSYDELYAMKCVDGQLHPVDISHIMDPHKMFTTMIKDREGNLWVSSYDMGYTIYFSQRGVTNYMLPDLKKKLLWDVNLVNVERDGDLLWLGQDRYGLVLYDQKQQKCVFSSIEELGEVNIVRKSLNGDGVWANRRSGSQVFKLKYDGSKIKVLETVSLRRFVENPGSIIDIQEDRSGNLWMLTTTNIFIKRQGEDRVMVFNGKLSNLSALVSDAQGNMWCISDSKLYRLSCIGTGQQCLQVADAFPLVSGETVKSLCFDRTERLWVLTSYGRLFRSDAGKHHYVLQELLMTKMTGMPLGVEASKDNVWVVTNRQVLCYNLKSGCVSAYQTSDQDICVSEFRYQAFCNDGSGGVYAGGHNGLVHFDGVPHPVSLPKDFRPVVCDVEIDGKSLFFEYPDSESTIKSISLNPEDYNIRISYATLLYQQTGLRLFYKLEGFDSEWVEDKEGRLSAFYNKLPKGKYVFMLKVASEDGKCEKSFRLMEVEMCPAWYETWWAYILYALLLGVLTFIVYRKLSDRSKMKNMKKMKVWMVSNNEEPVEVVSSEVEAVTSNTDGEEDLPQKNSQVEEVFLQNLVHCIEQHIDDSEFGLDALAAGMSMSRSTLHRRVKLITGMTPLDVIRDIRLKKACALLREHRLTISEVAYSVGFTNPKYFTKCFKEQFGQTPSEYEG